MTEKGKEKFLYLSLKNKIKSDYAHMPYYTPLPSERNLCEKYSVSRPTIRKTLQILEKEGVIKQLQGKGTFFLGDEDYVETAFTQGQRGITFYDTVVASGNVTTSKVLFQNIEKADKAIASKLNIKVGDQVFRLERLRYINSKLYSLSNSYISYKLCPELLEKDFTSCSLHKTMAQYNLHPYKVNKIIETNKADEYEATHLGLSVGDPIAVTYAEAYDTEGNILEYDISKSSAFQMRIELTIFNNKSDALKKL